MSANLYELFTEQFSTNLELLLQQMGSLLRGKVKEGFHVGKMASPVNQIGAIQMKAPAGRFAPIGRVDASFVRRWVFPREGDIPQLIDSFDELETIVDPKSMYVENAAMATGRAWDDEIISAALGTATTGVDIGNLGSETWASFSSAYNVAHDFGASATTGMTIAKLIETQRIFMHNHVNLDQDPATLVIGSQQHADLLNQVEVVSTEFNERPPLVDGRVKRFLGFDIVVTERLTVTSSDRYCFAFVKSGMYLGMWRDLTNRVSIREDLSSQPYQLYTMAMYGATRLQPGKVIQILANDATGADITP
jgi:hypothetical protein